MTTDEFRQLISRPESETLDYKENGYDLQRDRNPFIKDILSMANTPREQSALIVLGVRWTPERGSVVVGLNRQHDDVEFQDAFGQGRVQPLPRFTYSPIEFEGLQVGLLEIPVSSEGPYTPLKDYEGLQAGVVYYRRGTKNDRAVGAEVKRIVNWFQGGEIGIPSATNTAWNSFYHAVHQFESSTAYVLAVDRIPSTTQASLHALAMVPWRAVIDFDPHSENTGLLSSLSGALRHHRVIHRTVQGEYRVRPEPGVHWFFARGLAGRQDTLAEGSHKDWVKAYKQELGWQLASLAKNISPTPVVAVMLWSDFALVRHLRTLVDEIHGAFRELVEVVVVSTEDSFFQTLTEEAEVTFVPIGLRSLCAGIAVHYADLQSAADERCVLPTSSGAPIEVNSEDCLWLSEDLDLVDRSAGLDGNDDPGEYRRGGDISWRNLQLHHDCDRDITQNIVRQVAEDLQRRQTVRINLYHAPGAGGTTMAWRIAWDLHLGFPVAILKRCMPRDTAERISKVAALTESSFLIVIDGGQHSEREIDALYDFLKASQTPAVLLQVLRRFSRQKGGERVFWLDTPLTDGEADRFRNAYAQAVPYQKAPLEELARQHTSPLRNAFFFGLTAFGQDFRGLPRYVETRIASLSETQRLILVFISFAHYYGQQSIPAQAFASPLGLPRSKTLDLKAAFGEAAKQALVLLVESPRGEWRTAHHLVALEVIQQALSPAGPEERKAVWRQNLSSWAKKFASFCRGDNQTTSERLLELVRRVFVYRDNIEMLGTERAAQKLFAHLVEDIPSIHGRAELLRHLTECFPLEAHFHAHLGRFLGHKGEYEQGLECVEFAISLQPDDHVLHHMRGMIFRQRMRDDAGKGVTIDQLVTNAKKAAESFEEARRLCPDTEHGYISEIQMLIDLMDQAARGRRETVRELLSRPDTSPFIRQALERAEDLLDRVQHLHVGEQPGPHLMECRARLQRIYGDYPTALQAWDSLLSRPGIDRPPVRRQIVWTILRRNDGHWDRLSRKEIVRVRQLLEKNLEEETSDSTSLRLWIRAVRYTPSPPSLEAVIEKVSYWKANTGTLDAAYYLYVLHTIRAMDGSSQSGADAERALDECRAIARFRRDRTRSFEWLGEGRGIEALVHRSRLGEWKGDFWESTDALARLEGRIALIDGPQKGLVELKGGVKAFFVPAKSGFRLGRDENAPVICFLGFSYDGPSAWDVQRAET